MKPDFRLIVCCLLFAGCPLAVLGQGSRTAPAADFTSATEGASFSAPDFCVDQPDGTPCNDGNACTQNDTCQSGVCTGGDPVVCTAADQCHADGVCDPSTGACSNPIVEDGTACNDGNACTQNDTCQSGVCIGDDPVVCTAADQCHDAGVCDPTTGTCSNPVVADGNACDDGNACTQVDTCQSGVCIGDDPVVCTAADQCHADGVCNPASGLCSNPVAEDGTACNDGNACTQNDTCQSGVCTGSDPVVCTAADQCHADGVCDPASGLCSNPVAEDGTACNDGDACTQVDTCQSGNCIGGDPVVCTATDQCHADGVCNPATGTCSSPAVADGTACDDGDACTQNDTCQTGVCVGGDPVASTNGTFQITGIVKQGNNILITWTTFGGTTNVVQATNGRTGGSYSNNFTDLSGPLVIPGCGNTTTNYLDVGGATNRPSRFYRIDMTAQAPAISFASNGAGWQVNSSGIATAPFTGDVLTLTDDNNGEARSAWYTIKQSIMSSGFTASFTYQASGGITKADGLTFTIQNSGTLALGSAGGGLGYGGITPSAAVEFNLYPPNVIGTSYNTNGMVAPPYTSTSPVNPASGDPINVTLVYDPGTGTLSESLQDTSTSQTFNTSYNVGDLSALLGDSNAYIGFTGGTGGLASTQTISNFQFGATTPP